MKHLKTSRCGKLANKVSNNNVTLEIIVKKEKEEGKSQN